MLLCYFASALTLQIVKKQQHTHSGMCKTLPTFLCTAFSNNLFTTKNDIAVVCCNWKKLNIMQATDVLEWSSLKVPATFLHTSITRRWTRVLHPWQPHRHPPHGWNKGDVAVLIRRRKWRMRERRKSGGGPEHHLQDEEGPSRISSLIFSG